MAALAESERLHQMTPPPTAPDPYWPATQSHGVLPGAAADAQAYLDASPKKKCRFR